MKTIAYYISEYGFGHVARSIAIIRKLLEIKKDIRLIVCHSSSLDLLKSSLNDPRIVFRKVQTDIGFYLMDGSIEPDLNRMNTEYNKFLINWNPTINIEKSFLTSNHVDFLLSDISPQALEAAYQLGIPSIGISNFTWYTAYQSLIEEPLLEPLKQAYEKMTYFFALAGSREPTWTCRKQDYGFYSREFDWIEVEKIKKEVNPIGTKKIVFFGLGMKMDLEDIEKLPIWNSPEIAFIVSSNIRVNKSNVFSIPEDYIESQNYIAASDLVVTKAGWGTVSESVCSRTPLLIVDRKSMKEDQNTISYLKEHGLCETITWEVLLKLKIDNEFIVKIGKNIKVGPVSNDAEEIAKNIISIMNLKQ
ncbi:glycosyltransferase [Ferdinandcohnia sp. Marseille-Q9671]